MTRWPAQAFRLPSGITKSVSYEEVEATFEDMKELDLAQPPFQEFDLILPAKEIVRVIDKAGDINYEKTEQLKDQPVIIRYGNPDPTKNGVFFEGYGHKLAKLGEFITDTKDLPRMSLRDGRVLDDTCSVEEYCGAIGDYIAEDMLKLLIVLLATKNTVKTVTKNKLAHLGIGHKRPGHKYVTTISIGAVTEEESSVAAQSASHYLVKRRPHLRRGHIRRQHYGPENSFVKSIFIQPVFVNADEGWISQRTAYNLSRSHQ